MKTARIVILAVAVLAIIGFIWSSAQNDDDDNAAPVAPVADEVQLDPQISRAEARTCGNGVCDEYENMRNCPKDCSGFCGDGECNNTETCDNCPNDCKCWVAVTIAPPVLVLPVCGDNSCDDQESCETCPKDCGGCSVSASGEGPVPDSPVASGEGPVPAPPSDFGGGDSGPEAPSASGSASEAPAASGAAPEVGSAADQPVPLPHDAAGQPVSSCGDGTCDADETCNSCVADCGLCVQLPALPDDGLCSIAANGPYKVNVRAWPSTETEIIAQLDYEKTYTVVSTSRDRQWLQLADAGWVADWVVRSDSECDDLPGMEFDATDPEAALEVALVAHPSADLSLAALDKCNETPADLDGLPVPVVLDILASPDPCVTFERAQLVLQLPDYDASYWANLYGGPFGQDLGPNPYLLSVTVGGEGRIAAEEQCPELWADLQADHGQISLGHLYHIFQEEWNGEGTYDPVTGTYSDGICAAIQKFYDDGGVGSHLRNASHWPTDNDLPSCSVLNPDTVLNNNDSGVNHGGWPFIYYGGRVQGHYEPPYLLQSMSWTDKVAGLDRVSSPSVICSPYPVPECNPYPVPVITSPAQDSTNSGRPTITWEHDSTCIPDGFEVAVWGQFGLYTPVDAGPLISDMLPSTARSWTVPNQLFCDNWYTASVIAIVEDAQVSAGDQISFYVGPNNNCQPVPSQPDDNPNDSDNSGQLPEEGPAYLPGYGPDGPLDPDQSPTGGGGPSGQGSEGVYSALEDNAALANAIGSIIEALAGGAIGGSSGGSTTGGSTTGGSTATNPDLDEDGVPNEDDLCPETYGVPDWAGCSPPSSPDQLTDGDGDGLTYPFDLCPDEPGLVSNDGCPLVWLWDYDGDGIGDVADVCPEIPGFADYLGCPNGLMVDADNDGVINSQDACPSVPGAVEDDGCPPNAFSLDQDGDGVPDSRDYCPTVVGNNDATGCPVPNASDSDGDGVPDYDDACLDSWGLPDHGGCPVPNDADRDYDQVPDCLDLCPTVFGNTSFGCPEPGPGDADGDGIYDYEDACPALPGNYNDGCPAFPADGATNYDNDALYDYMDYCPTVYGEDPYGCPAGATSAPDAGSPMDADGDGIPDVDDECPTVAGTADSMGCNNQGDDDGDTVPNEYDVCPSTVGLPAYGGCPAP